VLVVKGDVLAWNLEMAALLYCALRTAPVVVLATVGLLLLALVIITIGSYLKK
jgi:hypothetical protein